MKRLFGFFLALLVSAAAFSQYVGDGYYRVRNKKTSRYIYVLDNTGSVNVQKASADMGAIELYKDTARLHHDPACIIYAKKVSTTAETYDLLAQGTGVHAIIGYYVTVYPKSDGSYQVYAEGKYLDDNETSNRDLGFLGTERTGDYRCWYIDAVNNTSDYFGILPTIQLGNKYYKPFYASFPFTVASSGMKVYYISAVHNTAAIISEATGTIPASTPVFIECSSPRQWENRLTLGGTPTASLSSNQLGGVYFNNANRLKSKDARTANNPVTMRTLSVTPDGRLCFVKNTALTYLPANESYLNVPATAADTLRVMTEAEYAVYSRVASVTLDQTELTLLLGGTTTLTATVLPTTAVQKTLTWTSSNPAVASVDATGVVTALSVGTATITATSTDGTHIFSSCTVTVNPIVASGLSLSQGLFKGVEGDSVTLTATFVPANTTNQTLTWSSSDPTVASVTDGLVRILGVGMATITATTTDGTNLSATCTVVGSPVQAASLTLSATTFQGVKGDTTTLVATVLPANTTNPAVRWTTSDASVATVQDGHITLHGVGTATVTATTTDGSALTATCRVTVNPVLVTGITLSHTLFSGIAGDTLTLTASVTPASATDKSVSWTTSNASVATVQNGLITILSVGEAVISVHANDASGVSATCRVVGNAVPVSEIQITQTVGLLADSLHKGDRITLAAQVLPLHATNKAILWKSSDSAGLRIVSSSATTCTCEAKKVGQYIITAAAQDESGVTAQFAVSVLPTLATSLTLAQDTLRLSLGDSARLHHALLPVDVTNPTVTWTSTLPDVVSVDSLGMCRTKGVGEATVIVRTVDGSGLSASCFIQVADTFIPPTMVTSVTLSRHSADLLLGDSLSLSCTVLPVDATNKYVAWTSSNPAVVSVDARGLCRARSLGSAMIIATALDGSGFADTCHMVVNPILAEQLTISRSAATLLLGNTLQLTHTLLPANTTHPAVVWTSSDPTVVTVDTLGFCRAVGLGHATIRVATLDGSSLSDSCAIQVNPILAERLLVAPHAAAVRQGDSLLLTTTVLPANTTNAAVRWTSSDPTTVTVDSLGCCRTLRVGNATVTAYTTDGSGLSDSCRIMVTPVMAESITLSHASAELHVKDTFRLTYTLMPENTTTTAVIWTSSNPTVVMVDANGLCKALSLGTATVSVMTLDGSGLQASCSFLVTPVLADSVALSQHTLTLTIGGSATLTAQVLPANTTNPAVLWESSDRNTVSVDAQGRIRALSVGTATIKASTADGSLRTDSCIVTVEPVWVTSIVLSADTLSLYNNETKTLTATVLPQNATFKQITWHSLDESILTVSEDGRITGVHEGQTRVQAVSAFGQNGDVVAECRVEVLLWTSLENIIADDPQNNLIFDLTGRRLDHVPSSGLYIVGGKVKYVILK